MISQFIWFVKTSNEENIEITFMCLHNLNIGLSISISRSLPIYVSFEFSVFFDYMVCLNVLIVQWTFNTQQND